MRIVLPNNNTAGRRYERQQAEQQQQSAVGNTWVNNMEAFNGINVSELIYRAQEQLSSAITGQGVPKILALHQ